MRYTNHYYVTGICLSMVLLCVSCRQFNELRYGKELYDKLEEKNVALKHQLDYEESKRELHAQAQARFSLIRRMITERKLDIADAMLAEMRSLDEFREDVESLQELVKIARRLDIDTTELAVDKQLVLNESTEKLRLPDSYDKTVVHDSVKPYDAPPSELEAMLDKKVSMQINNMPLEEFAMKLGELNGLNVADPMNVVFSNEAIKSKTFSANFKDVPLKELFAYISRNLGVDFNVVSNLIWVTAAATDTSAVPLETQIIPLHHGIIPSVPEGVGVLDKTMFASVAENDDDLETALKAFYATSKTGGSYTLFRTRNMLLINDTRANIRRVEELVKALDKAPYQVLIEARFLTVSQSDLKDVGMELKHYNGGHSGETIEPDNATNANISDFSTELGAIASGNSAGYGGLVVSGILGNRSFDVLLSAIENKTSTVTLSAPRITTLNNRSARIRKGDKRYYFEQYTLQTVDNGDKGKDQILVPNGKPTSLSLGITFDVKVNIGNDGKTVFLGLKPEIIDFRGWEDYMSTETTTANNVTTTKSINVKIPRTHEQTIAASVAINSGETVILGGMVENATERVIKRIPFLGELPFIGWLFRHTEETSNPSNLLIFVTATVIDENGKYVVVEE